MKNLRPKNIDTRIPKTLSLDLETYREFEKLVGTGNISEEIRAFMRDRVEQSKKEEGLAIPNPLNLHRSVSKMGNNNRQSTLFEHFPTKDVRLEITKYIDEHGFEMDKLETLRLNCNTVVSVIKTRKQKNAVIGEVQRREGIQSNDEILAPIKRAQRGIPLQ